MARFHLMTSRVDGGRVRYGLLGPLEVRDAAGMPVDLGGAQPRTVLVALLAAGGRVVPSEALVDAIWGERPPASAAGTLQTYVSRLRRALAAAGAADGPGVLRSEPPGYRLAVEPDEVDFRRFERLAAEGAAALAAGRVEEAHATLVAAESLWRGAALSEHRDAPFARGLATRLEERRLAVLEQRLEADLALGRAGHVVAEATEAVGAEPLREQLRWLLALALYRTGRQSDALRALTEARRTLVEELGVEPGRALRELEMAILAHDPALDLVAPRPGSSTPPSPWPSPAAAAAPALPGRGDELAKLRAALGELGLGTRVAVVEGEPGIGKTALLDALAAEAVAGGALVAWGRTLEGGATPAFWPWIEVLRTVVEARPEAVGGLEPLLDPGPAAERDPVPGDAFHLFEAVAEALTLAARHQPVVVLLDDLQWADGDSLELLSFLVGRLREEPVLLVLTVRQLELGRSDAVVQALAAAARRPHSRRLSLRGLDEAATGELVAAALGDRAPEGLVEVVHARSGGNPFFAGELARLLAEQPDAQDEAEVPAGVRDVVRQRLARLPAGTRELLPLAAVLGRDVEPTLLAAAAGRPLDDCLDALEPALVTHLLVAGGRRPGSLRFAHALVREVLVDDLSSLRRARLHLRAAEALQAEAGDAEDRAEVVAEHLWEAVPLGVGLRAAAALERAGDVAVWRTASDSAERLFERALELRRAAGDDEGELAALLRLGAAQRAGKGFGAAVGTFTRARELAARTGRTAVVLELLWAEWGEADTACDFARGRRLADQLGAIGRSSEDPVVQAAGLAAEGIQRLHEGGVEDARRHLDEAHALVERIPRSTSPGFAADHRLHTEAFRLLVHDLTGTDAEQAFDALAAGQTDLYSATVVRSFSVTAAAALGDLQRSERLAREESPTFYDVFNRMAAGAVVIGRGEVEAGRAVFDEALRRYRGEAGRHSGLGLFLANAGLALLTAGHADEAEAYVQDARSELDTYGERYPEPVVLLAEAQLALARGAPPESVLSDLEAASALATSQGAHGVAGRIAAAAAAAASSAGPDRPVRVKRASSAPWEKGVTNHARPPTEAAP